MADSQPVAAEHIASEEVEWLWMNRIPRRMITIIGGRPDQGKGLCATRIAADVSRMMVTDPITGERRRGRVLYSAAEDSHSIMTKPRLEAAGALLPNVLLWRFQIPSMFNELATHIKDNHIDLVILDPLAAHLSHGVSRHSDNIRTVLNPLTELIEETGTAVIIIEHVLKRVPQSGHPLAAIGGSGSGIVAASRMAFLFGIDPKDSDVRWLCPVKHNITEDDIKAVKFELDTNEVMLGSKLGEAPYLMFNPADPDGVFDPMNFLSIASKPGRMGRPADKMEAGCQWLTDYLYAAHHAGKKEVQAGVVYEDALQHGFPNKTIRRSATKIEVVTNPPGGGRNTKWGLPDELIDLLDEANGRGIYAEGAMEAALNDEPVSADEVGLMLSDDDFSQLLGEGSDNE